jgi:hypothetical protein
LVAAEVDCRSPYEQQFPPGAVVATKTNGRHITTLLAIATLNGGSV